MQTIIVIFALLTALAFFAVAGCKEGNGAAVNQEALASSEPPVITANAIRALRRDEIRDKLQCLAAAPPPEMRMGAMCYDMAYNPMRLEYVCPVCGEKTLYAMENAERVQPDYLATCRRTLAEVQELCEGTIVLDESPLCQHCRPAATERLLALEFHYADGTHHRVSGVTDTDLQLLREFFSGERSHTDFYDATTPLKDYLGRLEELLGVTVGESRQ